MLWKFKLNVDCSVQSLPNLWKFYTNMVCEICDIFKVFSPKSLGPISLSFFCVLHQASKELCKLKHKTKFGCWFLLLLFPHFYNLSYVKVHIWIVSLFSNGTLDLFWWRRIFFEKNTMILIKLLLQTSIWCK